MTALTSSSWAMSLRATLQAAANALGGDAPTWGLNYQKTHSLGSGTAAGEADLVFAARFTIAASGSQDLDLAGALSDAFGGTLTFVKVKALYVYAATTNTNNAVVQPGASNPFTGPFGGTTPTLTVPPDGELFLSAPKAGWPVTPATGDILTIANSGAGTSVVVDVVVLGTSA